MNLFNSNVTAIFSFVTAIFLSVIFVQKTNKKDRRKLLVCLAVAITTALLLQLIINYTDKSQVLPGNFWLMVLPLTASLAGAVYLALKDHKKTFSKKRYIPVVVLSVLSSVLLAMVSVNNYYHYYPTLQSVFGIKSKNTATILSQQTTTVQIVNQKQVTSQKTVEGALYGQRDASTDGTIDNFVVPGTVSHFKARDGFVYVPAIAQTAAKVNLPVIVLTQGVPGSTTDWLYGGDLKHTMDAFAADHKGVTPFVFVVDDLGSGYNDTECVDSPRGNVETFFSQDVPAYIKAHYEVNSDPSAWAVGGLSLGGTCGLLLTLRHPDVYRTFMDLGGESMTEIGSPQETISKLFGGSQAAYQAHQPLELLAARNYLGISGFFAIGKEDKKSLVTDMKKLFETAQSAKIQSVYEAIGGVHSFNVWAQGYKDALPWLSNRVGATECAGKCF